jgi:hypothetical protein
MVIPEAKLDHMQNSCDKMMSELNHHEMWGVQLVGTDTKHLPTRLVLAKFLQANAGDKFEAMRQFRKALIWRKKSNPRQLMKRVFDSKRFAGIGYIQEQQGVDGKVVVVFAFYGHMKHELIHEPQGLEE